MNDGAKIASAPAVNATHVEPSVVRMYVELCWRSKSIASISYYDNTYDGINMIL